MSTQGHGHHGTSHGGKHHPSPKPPAPPAPPGPPGGTTVRQTGGPQFAQPQPTPDPTKFTVKHPSDAQAYKELDALQAEGKLFPNAIPVPRGGTEPQLGFADLLGSAGATVAQAITGRGQIVFHAVGDTGNISRTSPQNEVSDKMVSDFTETDPAEVPQFFFHLGDIIYNFGEAKYYYDQFYEPYRNYPAPILGLAGNHDGIVAPGVSTPTLQAFLDNFCQTDFIVQPEAGGLDRTAQIQPGVFYTFEAPFVRVLALYSNTLEDPGVISSQNGKYSTVSDIQLDYLRAALTRVKTEKYAGALIIAYHHPSYTAGETHGWSLGVTADIDAICDSVGVWPHAVLSAHAHNYQRFTRTHGAYQIPYIVAGGGGHNIVALAADSSGLPVRTPTTVQAAGSGTDLVVLENYDDTNYGYLRIVASATQLRIEYHSATDIAVKSPNDMVTISLADRTLAGTAVPATVPAHKAPTHKAGHGHR